PGPAGRPAADRRRRVRAELRVGRGRVRARRVRPGWVAALRVRARRVRPGRVAALRVRTGWRRVRALRVRLARGRGRRPPGVALLLRPGTAGPRRSRGRGWRGAGDLLVGRVRRGNVGGGFLAPRAGPGLLRPWSTVPLQRSHGPDATGRPKRAPLTHPRAPAHRWGSSRP